MTYERYVLGPALRRDCPGEILDKDLDSRDSRAGVGGAGRVDTDLISHRVPMRPAASMGYSGDSSEPSVWGPHGVVGMMQQEGEQ